MAVAGPASVLAPLRAAGLTVVDCSPGPAAAGKVEELIAGGNRVVFYAKELEPSLEHLISRYRGAALPCLMPLPTGTMSSDSTRLRELVKRAVGVDIAGADRITKGVGR